MTPERSVPTGHRSIGGYIPQVRRSRRIENETGASRFSRTVVQRIRGQRVVPDVSPRRVPTLKLVAPMPPAGPQDIPGDDALMTLAATGQQHAYVRLVERYERRIRGFCRLLTRDDTLAYDLAQEVFLKIWKRRAQYRPEGRFKEYLFTVARNECRSAQRKRAVVELFGLSPNLEQLASPLESGPDESSDARERLQILEAGLTRLPEKFRVPLTLRFIEGLDYAEIARIIGRTESAARSRIFYGLKELAALMPAEVMS